MTRVLLLAVLGALLVYGAGWWWELLLGAVGKRRSSFDSIAPFLVVGKTESDPDGKLGHVLAHMLRARLAVLVGEIAETARTLRQTDRPPPQGAAPRLRSTSGIQTQDIDSSLPLRLPDRVFEPLDIKLSVSGVDVSGVLASARKALMADRTLQATVHFGEADKATVTANFDAGFGGSLWIETKAANEELVSDLAYGIAHREFAKERPEVAALTRGEFKQIVVALSAVATQERLITQGRRRDPATYAALSREIEELLRLVPDWRALRFVAAQVAEKANLAALAVGHYRALLDKRELSPEWVAWLKDKVEALEGSLARSSPPDSVASETSHSTDGRAADWVRRLLGVESLEMSREVRVGIQGTPTKEFLKARSCTVLKTARGAPWQDTEPLALYVTQLAGVVLSVAPRAHLVFSPIEGASAGGRQMPDSALMNSVGVLGSATPPVEIVLIPYGPLAGEAWSRFLENSRSVLVIPAGNEGPRARIPLLGRGSALFAAAVDVRGEPAPFSQRGDGCVFAPGVSVESASGTGPSAALAAAIAARVVAERPNLAPKELRRLLLETSQPAPGQSDPKILNLAAALKGSARTADAN